MTFVDDLKDITKRKTGKKFEDAKYHMDEDVASEIRNDPQYDKVLQKLQQLTAERDILINRLRKIELDIDTCLVIISINREREDIASKEEK